MRRLRNGDYGVSWLLHHADLRAVREVVVPLVEGLETLEPNLIQVLSMLGGRAEREIIRVRLERAASRMATDEEASNAAYLAQARLRHTTSLRAVRVLDRALASGFRGAMLTAARVVVGLLPHRLPVAHEKILVARLPTLLSSEDDVFTAALPALMLYHYPDASLRCVRIFEHGDADLRAATASSLLRSGYPALRLLVRLFHSEADLRNRVIVAKSASAAFSSKDLESVAREALNHRDAAVRLDGARLLDALESKVAARVARRRDPDPTVVAELLRHRKRAERGNA